MSRVSLLVSWMSDVNEAATHTRTHARSLHLHHLCYANMNRLAFTRCWKLPKSVFHMISGSCDELFERGCLQTNSQKSVAWLCGSPSALHSFITSFMSLICFGFFSEPHNITSLVHSHHIKPTTEGCMSKKKDLKKKSTLHYWLSIKQQQMVLAVSR